MSGPPPRVIDRRTILNDPWRAADDLVDTDEIYGLTDIVVRWADPTLVVYWITLEPWEPMAAAGYPTEQVAITIWADGRTSAVPVNARTRTWEHRQRFILGEGLEVGELCLWNPRDPRRLRWLWSDGFAAYITVVHRHLQAEEFFRRNGQWPVEAAPHGSGTHPILSEAMRRVTYPEAS